MRYTEIWREARRLHNLGFAIHWLHPNSKRPIEMGWTTGPRKDWKALNELYRPDFNVGVRLGSPSKIGDAYLAVIDVDVKSTEKRHRLEALEAVRKLIGGQVLPEVSSGRGNGSRHYYCVTASPFKTFNPFKSTEMVKVRMPSKSPSKRELSELSEAEVKEGLRISPAWEISLYSDGRQVVLPPSIHPDTYRPYAWVNYVTDLESLPLIKFQVPKENALPTGGALKTGKPQETVEDFQIDETLDVRWLPDLTEKMRNLIVKGIWKGSVVDDRSAYLLPATSGLVSAGLDKHGILTVLTDRSTFLGECAFEHAKTNSRKRAAQWLWNYTVKKVLEERDPVAAFEGKAVVVPATLDADSAKAQDAEIEATSKWGQYLEKTDKGATKATLNNCKLILMNACGQKNFVGRNEFAVNDYYLCDTPWQSKKGDAVTDIDIVRIKFFCTEKFKVEFSDNTINQALLNVADLNRFNPVHDYLKSLDWDGSPRIETWLKDFAGATGPDEYLRAVSRKVLVAMIKRVFEPGCKFDYVLVLEGLQGKGKSTLLSSLAGETWFSDETLNIGDKDAVLTMQSKWLIELGELSSLSKAEIELTKAFISRRTDRIRAPYGKRVEEFPRQCVFMGSTNLDEYLRDETGNRRFWPVKTGSIDVKGLAAARDQLFAEAYAYYLLKEPVYLESDITEQLARTEQDKRGEVDEWLPTVRDLVTAEGFAINGFEMRDVSKRMDQFGANRLSPWDQKRIARCLRFLGFERFQETTGLRRKLWRLSNAFKEGRTEAEPLGTLDYGSSKKVEFTSESSFL